MNKYIQIDEWMPSDGIKYTKDSKEMEFIRSTNNTLVVAGPGAGKTELLAQKATFLLQTNTCKEPRKILALSFKVDAAENLRSRIGERCKNDLVNRAISKTYDAFFKEIVDRFYYLLPDEYGIKKDYKIIKNDEVRPYFERLITNFRYLTKDSKNFLVHTYLTESALPIVETEYGDRAREIWKQLLNQHDTEPTLLTYSMRARLAEYIIDLYPTLKSIICKSFEYVVLDEFQDTTELQYSIIKKIFKDSDTRVIAVGDKKQCIMRWAGAKQDIFEVFKEDFTANEITLFINHRSVPKLLRVQESIVKQMLGVNSKIDSNDKWSGDEGVSEIWFFDTEQIEAESIASMASEGIKNGVPINEVCILLRQTPGKYCSKIIEELEKLGVKARYEDEYQELLKEKLTGLLIKIIKLSLNRGLSQEWIDLVLLFKNIRGYSFNTSIENINKLEYELNQILDYIQIKLNGIVTQEYIYELVIEVINFFCIENLELLYPQYTTEKVYEIIEQFSRLLFENYSKGDWELTLAKFMGETSIPIMTIHKSKGLEFNTVILVGLEDEMFWGYDKNPEEELCTFFVAISRAKEKLYFTYCETRAEHIARINKISLFYKLLDESHQVEYIDKRQSEQETSGL